LQLALGVAQTLKNSNNSHMDQLYGIEKGMLHILGEEIMGNAALSQITQLVQSRKERSINVNDIITLLLHVHSLLGESFSHLENELEMLKDALKLAVEEDDSELSEDIKQYSMDKLFRKLKDVARTREALKKYRMVFEPGTRAQPACYFPFLRQITDDIFNQARPELLDIEYKPMGLKDMFKTGFSMFMNKAKPHPCDNSAIVIFVIGGVTSSEVRLIKETISARKPAMTVLVGSTKIITPSDVLKEVMQS